MSARSALQRAAQQQREKINVDKEEEENKIWEGYAWESKKLKSWDQIEEDPETGRLKSFNKAKQIARKKRRDDGLSGVRRGVIRYCVIIIDMSESLRLNDYKPSRAELIIDSIITFIKEFFDQNPISQISLVLTRDSDACKLCNFTNNLKKCINLLKNSLKLGPFGSASLQNSLVLANKVLSGIPVYGMKEILICYGSLSTCDPNDIHQTIQTVVDNKIRCCVIGMAAELFILKNLASKTNGKYIIAIDEAHYRDSLANFIIPPTTTMKQVSASLIRMGFPMLKRLPNPLPYCNNPSVLGKVGYHCPRCGAWLSDMPCECVLCGMTLVSSPHLARSYHHLFPVPKYISLDAISSADIVSKNVQGDAMDNNLNSMQNGAGNGNENNVGSDQIQQKIDYLRESLFIRCTGCVTLLKNKDDLRVLCPSCLHPFCIECDVFVHESLHYCPGCGLEQ